MVSIISLWLPILVSAVFVFIASSLIHMLLPYHRSDFKKVPNEDAAMEELRKLKIPPGDYGIPYAENPKEMKSSEFQEKFKKGPLAFLTVLDSKAFNMGNNLALWFLYCLVVSIFAAYITGRALTPEADYLEVFRFAGATAFIGYTVALWQNSIWYKRSVKTNLKNTFDGLIYALLTAGTFGWLWPQI